MKFDCMLETWIYFDDECNAVHLVVSFDDVEHDVLFEERPEPNKLVEAILLEVFREFGGFPSRFDLQKVISISRNELQYELGHTLEDLKTTCYPIGLYNKSEVIRK